MEQLILVVIGVIGFFMYYATAQSISYTCALDGDNLIFRIESESDGYRFVTYNPTTMDMTCISSTDPTSQRELLEITVNTLTNTQQYPADTDCMWEWDPVNAVYLYTVAYTTDPSLTFMNTDMYTILQCDPATVTTIPDVLTLNAAIGIQLGLTQDTNQIDPETDAMQCFLRLASDDSAVTSEVTLGEEVYIECIYTHPDINSGSSLSPKAAYMKNLGVQSLEDGSDRLELSDGQGCPKITNPLHGYYMVTANGMTVIGDTSVQISTANFRIARLIAAPTLFFTFGWGSCTSRDDMMCSDPEANCNTPARKKRSADDIPLNGNVTLATKITMGKKGHMNQGSVSSPKEAVQCNDMSSIWIVGLVVGILLLLLLIFTAVLLFRMIRGRKSSRKLEERGVQNPTYG